MGELLLVCSLVTLILLVLYINKKKQEERQFYAELQSRKRRDSNNSRRYSRDDSMLHNKRSPLPGDSSFVQRDRYRTNYSPIYDRERHSRNYDYFNTSNQFNKSYLTPTGLNDTYEKYEKEKRNMRNLMRSDDVDLPTDKFPQNTSNNKNNQANFNFANEFAKFNNFQRQSLSNNNLSVNVNNLLTKSQSVPVCNPTNNFSTLNNGIINANVTTQASENGQPGYKVIKLEDFLSSENNFSSTSPMFKNQPKITLDEVNPSLIKYLHKNDEAFRLLNPCLRSNLKTFQLKKIQSQI
jgi:hypothetical protein